jgi:hypothetical protein
MAIQGLGAHLMCSRVTGHVGRDSRTGMLTLLRLDLAAARNEPLVQA